MAENVTLNPVVTFTNDTTAVNVINGNNTTITNAFTDVLSRSGVSPNQMNSTLDMNSNQIINLPPPNSINSPARLVDVVTNPTVTIPPVGTSGAVVGLLNTNNTVSGNNTYSGTSTFTNTVTLPASTITASEIVAGAAATNVGTLGGNLSGTLPNPTVVSVNSVTYPASPSTNTVPVVTATNAVTYQAVGSSQLAANAVTNSILRQSSGLSVIGNTGTSTGNPADIIGTARQTLAVNTGGTGLAFAQPRGDQLLGTATNDNATAGNVGEYISSSNSGVSLTSNTPANITSISLTAGDWLVWANTVFTFTGTTTFSQLISSISTTSATLNTNAGNLAELTVASNTPGFISNNAFSVGPIRVSIASTTTYFLVVQSAFSASTVTGAGIIQAVRRR